MWKLNKTNLKNALHAVKAPVKLLVAFSGGVDSHVLLHLLALLQNEGPNYQIRACHINHGLSVNADKWQVHCQQVCLDLGVTLSLDTIHIQCQPGESMEALAREMRYAALAKVLQPDEALLTAHTQDDQAETLLLQALRGAGVRGLAAMPKAKPFAAGLHIRPLLDFTREQVEAYADKAQLTWVEDESNVSLRFDRNYIRHQVLPLLKERWPATLANLSRSALHCASGANCLAEYATEDLKLLTDAENCLAITKLLTFNSARQKNILRHWLLQQNMPLPDTKVLMQVETMLAVKHDATPLVQWDQFEVRRFAEKLYAMPQLGAHDASQVLTWDMNKPITLPSGLGVLQTERTSVGIRGDLDPAKFTIRFRHGGERLCPVGHQHSKLLKHCLQEWQVPPWLRERIPILYYEESIVAVINYAIVKEFSVKNDGLRVIWTKR